MTNKDELRHVSGVFRCIKDDWKEGHEGEHKYWKDWKLITHRVVNPIQPNSKTSF